MIDPKARAAFDALLNPQPLIKGGRVTANWLPDGRFWFVTGEPEDTVLRVFDPATASVSNLFDTGKVRKAFRAALGREAPYRGLPFNSITLAADGSFTVTIEGRQYTLDAGGEKLTPEPLPDLAEAMFGSGYGVPETYIRPGFYADNFPSPAMLSPDGRWFASLRDQDVWLRSAIDGRRERMTDDGEALNGWDVESIRNTTSAGGQWRPILNTPWSPTGLKLFVTRFDARGAKPWVRVRWSQRSDEVENTYMARAGERLPTAAPYVIDILSRKLVKIDVPIEDRILLLVGWSTDGSSVCFVQFSRDMSWAGIYRADASSGEARLLFEEKTETFLRMQHQVIGGRSGVHAAESIKPATIDLAPFTGRFESLGNTIDFTVRDGKLYAAIDSDFSRMLGLEAVTESELVPLGGMRFVPRNPELSGNRMWDVAFWSESGDGRPTHFLNGMFAHRRIGG